MDSVWLSNPLIPGLCSGIGGGHGGSRSIPLSAECESSTVIPSTPLHTDSHASIHGQPHTHTHTHSLRSQGLGRICAVRELLRSAFQGKGPAKATKPAKRYLVLVSHLPQLPATRQGSILPHRLADAAGRSTAVTGSDEKWSLKLILIFTEGISYDGTFLT